MKNKTINNFFNSTVKPSDFKFKWRIIRYKNENIDKVYVELDQLGLKPTIDAVCNGKMRINCMEAKKAKAKFNELVAKYTSKHYTYVLQRHCSIVDSIVHEIAKVSKKSKRAYNKLLKSSNFLTMAAKSKTEHAFDHTFSSLSAMQKWVNKNNIKLDVYKLWESLKPKSK